MKKALALILVFVLTLSLVACDGSEKVQTETQLPEGGFNVKVGFIFNGDESEGNANAHYRGAMEMKEQLGLADKQVVIKWNVAETEKAYNAAVDLADQGCDIVFANSSGHEEYMIRAAIEYPDVQFCQAAGFQAASCGLKNMHNYFNAVHQSRYVSGIVAGMKINEMIEQGKISPEQAKIGYVGAFTSAEVISGYTAFYLGARSVCETVTMDVTYVGSWSDESLERKAAEGLIAGGCVLLSHHTDTTGVATACEEAGVPVVGYWVSMTETAPTWALTSATVNWAPYITFAVKSVLDGTGIPTDWSEGYEEGAVKITELNESCVAEGTAEAVSVAEESFKNGTLHVFDITKWTVEEKTITTTATEELNESYHGLEYIMYGAFLESASVSAPAFSFRIDGITELNQAYEN